MSIRPSITAPQAVQLYNKLFQPSAVVTSCTELASYDDRNFLIRTATMPPAVLKVHNHQDSCDADFLEAQNCVLQFLHARGFSVSAPVMSMNSRYLEFIDLNPVSGQDSDTQQRPCESSADHVLAAHQHNAVRLLSYLPGTVLGTVQPSSAVRYQLGRLLGQVDIALLDFQHPAAHRDHEWTLHQAPAVIRRYGQYSEDRHELLDAQEHKAALQHAWHSTLLLEVAAAFEERILQCDTGLQQATIHGDANEHNVLVDSAASQVVGLLDFGDFHYGFRIAELAIAMVYQAGMAAEVLMQDHSGPCNLSHEGTKCALQAAAAVAAGYNSLLPLTPTEWALLPLLMSARMAQSLAKGSHAAQQDPGNAEYTLLSQRYNRAVLLSIWQSNGGVASTNLPQMGSQQYGQAGAPWQERAPRQAHDPGLQLGLDDRLRHVAAVLRELAGAIQQQQVEHQAMHNVVPK